MRSLITRESNPELIKLYKSDPLFYAVVENAEMTGMTYVQMLEMAVIKQAEQNDILRDRLVEKSIQENRVCIVVNEEQKEAIKKLFNAQPSANIQPLI